MRLFRLLFLPLGGVLVALPPANGAFALEPPPAALAPPSLAAEPAKPKPKPAPMVHEGVVARADKRPSVHPDSLKFITDAAERYLAFANAGGWPILPQDAALKLGDEGELVLMLRQRLAAEGDLATSEAHEPKFDAALAGAVKRFQARHGHTQNGLVIGPTLAALRVSARERAAQLAKSASRLSTRNFAFGSRYVAVNLPSASVEAIENGVVEKRFVAVVGKKERASPEVETRITNINLNPTWTVPHSIVKKDIIPKMREDAAYLSKAKIRIIGASGTEIPASAIDWKTERALAFNLRQDPGSGNALGQLRIDMPNREAVYMHDTPSKKLFARDNRFHSSGCVRVENVRDFAVWLLDDDRGAQGWDRAAIDAAIKEGRRVDIRPREPIPVIWAYLTGYVTPDGIVHFRSDFYGLDSGLVASQQKNEGEAAPPSMPAARKAKAMLPVEASLDSAGLEARIAASGAPVPLQRIDP
ncbi:MAG: L,D-transpeptidase family protein [Proteobacteria bacterium]|nr:L,D-transpeptidase family protein [Pseudomonadota bacterium]